jgi:hypothetical protein
VTFERLSSFVVLGQPNASLDLSKAAPDTTERIDHIEGIVDCFELVTHSFDVAIHCGRQRECHRLMAGP